MQLPGRVINSFLGLALICFCTSMEAHNIRATSGLVDGAFSGCAQSGVGTRAEAFARCPIDLLSESGAAGGPTPSDHSASSNVKSSDQSGLGEANRLGTGSGEAAQGVKPIVGRKCLTWSKAKCLTIDGKKVDCSEDPEIVKYAAAKKSNQLTSVSPQNEPGCIPHPGLATQSWFARYRGMDLPAELRNIKYRNATVDCNPASCDNPPQCSIPPCKAFDYQSMIPQYDKAQSLSRCPAQGTQGCRITGQILAHQAINKDSHWKGFLMFHPATRFGYTFKAVYPPGFVQCYPAAVKKDHYGNTGSWLIPGAKNCNPDDLKVCTKMVVAHTVLPVQSDYMHRRAVAVFYKTVWCIGPKCYVSKRGNCLRLKKRIMHKYASQSNQGHSNRALIELQAGRYDHGCSVAARKAADLVIASN